jgi:hypothetical protein
MLRQKDIRNINELITIPIEEFHSDYGEEYLKPLLLKYQNRVIAFEINPQYNNCKVLLEGDKKYFLLHLILSSCRIKRIHDKELRQALSNEMVVTNVCEFDRFKKILLLDNLNPKDLNSSENLI